MSKKEKSALETMLDEIKAEYEGKNITEEYALKVHEVSAISKGNVTDSSYEAICTAFKLGYARAKQEVDREIKNSDIGKLIDSAEARTLVLELAVNNHDTHMYIPDDILGTYMHDLGDIVRDLGDQYRYLIETAFKKQNQE